MSTGSSAVGSVARNAPCPCGSGKRYKDCHGAIPARETGVAAVDPDVLLSRAVQHLREGGLDAAGTLANNVLSSAAPRPEAYRIVAHSEYAAGRPDAALRALLRAAQALSSFSLPASEQLAIWSELNYMFTQALAGIDTAFAIGRREEYARWLQSLPAARADAAPLVSVVLVAHQAGPGFERTLESIRQQTYRQMELVVAYPARAAGMESALAAALRGCPFACRLLPVDAESEPALVNAGVRASQGLFVNVLPGDHEFAPDRLRILVEQVASRGVIWGFTGVAFADAGARSIAENAGRRIRRWREMMAAIPQVDTVGCTFINQDCVAVGIGSLFFSRALFDELRGVRDLEYTYVWDFCLRALWHAEPIHVPAALYRHCITDADDARLPDKQEYEAAQLAMFRDFYERASDPEFAPANPFAPCLRNWRLHFLKLPFQTGHVLMFGLAALERLGEMIIARRQQHRAVALMPGLNLIGFAFAELGLGESLRGLARACVSGGIPCSVRDVDLRLSTRQADRSIASLVTGELKHRASLYCLNPDMLEELHLLTVESAAAGIYAIGYWYWELERLPDQWLKALERFDEVWVASEFVAETVRRSTAKPVSKIPPPIEVTLSRPYRRAEFRLPEGRFLFAFSFDFNSFPARKNPEAVVAAFRKAFGDERHDVGLVMKSINGANRRKRLQALQELVHGDARIVFLDEFFTRDQVSGLLSVVDAYVSLHRSEGLGLGLAESMYLGKPVVGTAYSGNLEFMTESNSCLVDYALVPVGESDYIYTNPGCRWAEPDVDHAATLMRRLVDDTAFRRRIAEQGQHDVRSRFNRGATALLLQRRLSELGLI